MLMARSTLATGQCGHAAFAARPIARRQVEERLGQAVLLEPLSDFCRHEVIGKEELYAVEARRRCRGKAVEEIHLREHQAEICREFRDKLLPWPEMALSTVAAINQRASPALAPAGAFLKRHRIWVISITILIVLAGLPALTRLQFNFDPLALENQSSPALRSLFRLSKELPLKTARALVAPEQTQAVAAKLRALPEVAATWTIDSFVPVDQEKNLSRLKMHGLYRTTHSKIARRTRLMPPHLRVR